MSPRPQQSHPLRMLAEKDKEIEELRKQVFILHVNIIHGLCSLLSYKGKEKKENK